MRHLKKFALSFLFLGLIYSHIAQAADYYCEVMSLQGTAQVLKADGSKADLKQGDLLSAGDTVVVGDGSVVDIAYDKNWTNVTRLWAGTSVKIKSVFPTGLAMSKGDIFAKLGKLPAKSTFEIETPTAIAAVRGSAYRTKATETKTDVYNLHESDVEVHSKDENGDMTDDKVILKENEKTEIDDSGEGPKNPEKMTEEEIKENKELVSEVDQTLDETKEDGREGKIQDIETIEKEYDANLDKRLDNIIQEKELNSGAEAEEPEKETVIAERIEKVTEKVEEKNEREEDRQNSRQEESKREEGSKGKLPPKPGASGGNTGGSVI